jgi:hypothetical protein
MSKVLTAPFLVDYTIIILTLIFTTVIVWTIVQRLPTSFIWSDLHLSCDLLTHLCPVVYNTVTLDI